MQLLYNTPLIRWATLSFLCPLSVSVAAWPLINYLHASHLGVFWENLVNTVSYSIGLWFYHLIIPPPDFFCSPSWDVSLVLESTLAPSTLWSSISCEAILPVPWSQSCWAWALDLLQGCACHPLRWSKHAMRWVCFRASEWEHRATGVNSWFIYLLLKVGVRGLGQSFVQLHVSWSHSILGVLPNLKCIRSLLERRASLSVT